MEHIVKSPYPETPVPSQGCYGYITGRWTEYRDRIALVDSGSGDKYTFTEVQDVVHNIAGHLQSLGFSHGTNLAVCATNCVETLMLVLASWKLGGMVSLLNPLLKPGEVSGLITKTKPGFLFLDKEHHQKLTEVIPDKTILLVKEKVEGFPSFVHLREPMKQGIESIPPDVEAGAVILFSSGTTGPPKAVVLSHKNIVTQLHGIRTMVEAGAILAHEWKSQIVYQPMSHAYGLLISMVTMIIGASTIIMPRFELKTYLQLNADFKCEVMMLVPPLAVMFTKNSELVAQFDLSSIKCICCGAAFLHPGVAAELLKIIPTKSLKYITQGYGMTELAGSSHWMPSESFVEKHGAPDSSTSVGVVMPNTRSSIRDLETHINLPAYRRGEICVSGPGVMMGYLNDDKATAATIGADGWLKTGDIGYYDSNGYFYVVDRCKELIKYKAHQVSPSEVEDLLLSHPEIADAGVVGFPDAESGELPSAFIVLKPGVNLRVEEIQQFVAEKAAPFKKLRGPIVFVSQIPKTASGKILRRCILAELQAKHGNRE